ncbi:MAG: sigma-70 family RNA polymerase sigma factor [Planctomycetia bacterium]|nr:sigma-70 family RNA polymerase sigma factor [Planctomycetia bacterium]
MASISLQGVLRQVRDLAGARPQSEQSDGQLLDRFLIQHDQAAFEALVLRHGPMVQRLCRRILGDVHAAEDAFQAAFLVLARKAPSIRRRGSVGGWLYRVAYHAAVRAKTQTGRRQQREREAAAMQPTTDSTPSDARETVALVEEQLSRLPEKYRSPLVLCYLEGKSQVEAAEQLGCPTTSLASRLVRGRELLRGGLAKRGLVLSAAGTTALLTAQVASASVSADLAAQTARAVMVGTPAAGLSETALLLADGVLQTMAVGRRAIVLLTLLACGTLGLAAGVGVHQAIAPVPGEQEAMSWEGILAEPLDAEALTLFIDEQGRIATPGRPEPLAEPAEVRKFLAERYEELEQRALVRQQSRTDVRLAVQVRAHPETPHPTVLGLLRECHAAGFRSLQLPAIPCAIDLSHGDAGTPRLRIHADLAGLPTSFILRDAERGETVLPQFDQLQQHVQRAKGDGAPGERFQSMQLWSPQPLPFGRYVAVANAVVQAGVTRLHLGPTSLAEVRDRAAPAPAWDQEPPQRRPHGADEAGRKAALTAGYDWLAQHQSVDGSWSLEAFHLAGKCSCTGPGGSPESAAGASRKFDVCGTAFGLLPLLRGGFSHQGDGRHARTLERGLKYLLASQAKDGSFNPDMYQNGLAALALCEAYSRSRDANLRPAAQLAVDFIVDAQHEAGGWRYKPRMAGDLSITGWQVQVLGIAYGAGLKVPDETVRKANLFLDSVHATDGSGYGYTGPTPTPTMTASGLACRSWLAGEPIAQPGWSLAVDFLRTLAPDARVRNGYHYYHATLAMNQDAAAAPRWNPAMNRRLIEDQDWGGDKQRPHQHGSWSPAGDSWGSILGRVGQTSLALLTLQATETPTIAGRPEPRTAREVADLWDELKTANGLRGPEVVRQLILAPEQSLPLLRERLQPVAVVDGKLAQRWLTDLDSDYFAVRHKAEEELEKFGEGIIPTLRAELGYKPSLEKSRRIERVLERFLPPRATPAQVQIVRGVRVLEHLGTPDARQHLQALSQGAAGAFLTREAKLTLDRLAKRN